MNVATPSRPLPQHIVFLIRGRGENDRRGA
jgi:hypothetical protein